MADILTSNLYPPIIDSFMPAFVINEENPNCIVKFTIPNTNTISDINTNGVQVIIKNQKNNINSLKNDKAPAGVLLKTMQPDPEVNNGYFIEINPSELKDDQFYIDQFYKLQLRFTSNEIGVQITNNTIPDATWLSKNLNYFSEWSTVCLLKRISEPYIEFKSFTQLIGDDYPYCRSPFLELDEKLQFLNANENEYLSYYKLELYSADRETINGETKFIEDDLIEESDIIYNSEDTFINRIQYKFKSLLASGEFINTETGEIQQNPSTLEADYIVKIHITTNNLYTYTFNKNFIASIVNNDYVTIDFNIQPQPDQGRIRVDFSIQSPNQIPVLSDERTLRYIILHRTSSKSSFKTANDQVIPNWERLAKIRLADSDYSSHTVITIYDNSIESGVFYRYGIRVVSYDEVQSTTLIQADDYSICDFEDVFLNGDFHQLKLRYNSRVTSYKRIVMENKVETIGSRFPFIRRNTATNYKQFSINGLITFHTDDANIFLLENKIYGGQPGMLAKHKNHNIENGITPYNDYTKEREFREKVIDFLTSGKPILMRTMTEGNVLVRLMDINITPNQSLNNYICEFTATAIEIAEANFENYYKYDIFHKNITNALRNVTSEELHDHTHIISPIQEETLENQGE